MEGVWGSFKHYSTPHQPLHKTSGSFPTKQKHPPRLPDWLAFGDLLVQWGSSVVCCLACATLSISAAIGLVGSWHGSVRKPGIHALSQSGLPVIKSLPSFPSVSPSTWSKTHKDKRRIGFAFPRPLWGLLQLCVPSSPIWPDHALFCSQWQRQMKRDSNYSEQEAPTHPHLVAFIS